MKKSFMIAAIAAVAAMSACSTSETLDTNKRQTPINMSNSLISRANTTVATGSAWNIKAYKAAASSTEANVYDGSATGRAIEFTDVYNYSSTLASCYYTGSTATPKYRYYDGVNSYWFLCWGTFNRTDATIAASTITDITSPTTPAVNFTVDANASVDFVKSKTGELTVAAYSATYPQALQFYHTLSCITFGFRTQTYSADMPIVVTGVKFYLGKNSGTLDLSASTVGAWSALSGSGATYATTPYAPLALPNAVTYTTYESASGVEKQLYVMPQTMVRTGATALDYTAGDDYIEVTYTVGSGANLVTVTKKLMPKTTLDPGKKYRYNITLDLLRIDFTAVVMDWDETSYTNPVTL